MPGVLEIQKPRFTNRSPGKPKPLSPAMGSQAGGSATGQDSEERKEATAPTFTMNSPFPDESAPSFADTYFQYVIFGGKSSIFDAGGQDPMGIME